jgi:hypothetical protein
VLQVVSTSCLSLSSYKLAVVSCLFVNLEHNQYTIRRNVNLCTEFYTHTHTHTHTHSHVYVVIVRNWKLTSTLDVGGMLTSRSCLFTPDKEIQYRSLVGPWGRCGRVLKMSSQPEFDFPDCSAPDETEMSRCAKLQRTHLENIFSGLFIVR